jgi:hypothetical protein
MKYLFIFFLPLFASAESKILFELNGAQQLEVVGPGGGVTPEATVLWDERKDGPLPNDAPVGYADRVVDGSGKPSLVLNQAKKSSADSAVANKSADAAQDAADRQTIKTLLPKLRAKTATAAETRDILAAFLAIMKADK